MKAARRLWPKGKGVGKTSRSWTRRRRPLFSDEHECKSFLWESFLPFFRVAMQLLVQPKCLAWLLPCWSLGYYWYTRRSWEEHWKEEEKLDLSIRSWIQSEEGNWELNPRWLLLGCCLTAVGCLVSSFLLFPSSSQDSRVILERGY